MPWENQARAKRAREDSSIYIYIYTCIYIYIDATHISQRTLAGWEAMRYNSFAEGTSLGRILIRRDFFAASETVLHLVLQVLTAWTAFLI